MDIVDNIYSIWQFSLSFFILTFAMLGIYFWYHRSIKLDKSAFFLAVSLIAATLATASPIGVLADGYAFTAHMLQHMLLLLVVTQFFLLALFSKPRPQALQSKVKPSQGLLSKLGQLMTSPSVGWSLGVSIMWIWHIPMLCNAATGMTSVWGFQTATLLGAGVAFWWPIYGPSKERHLAPLSGVVYLFAACIGCSLLGIYIAFTPTSVCPIFLSAADPMGIRLFLQNSWGMNYARDQQLGGLIMWVPSCMLYVGTVMALMGRWYAGETGQEQKVQVK